MMRNNFTILVLLLNACLGSTITHADDVWTNYFVNPGQVTSMTRHGQYLWCGTEFGLYRWDTTDMTYEVFTRPGGRFQNDIKDIAVDSQGLVWVGFSESGVAAFDGANWINEYMPYTGKYSYKLSAVAVDAHDTFWFIAAVYTPMKIRNATLYSFDGEWHATKPAADQLNQWDSQYPAGLAVAPDGAIWCGIEDRLFRYDGTWELQATDILSYTAAFESSADGTIWICDGFRITMYADSMRTDIALPADFPIPPYLVDLDATSDAWTASANGGLLRIHDCEASVAQPHGDTQWLSAIFVDDAGTIWAGRIDGGISRLVDGEWVDYSVPSNDLFSDVHGFTEDRNGTLWIATGNGIGRYLNSKWETVVPREKLLLSYPNDPYYILFDTGNNL